MEPVDTETIFIGSTVNINKHSIKPSSYLSSINSNDIVMQCKCHSLSRTGCYIRHGHKFVHGSFVAGAGRTFRSSFILEAHTLCIVNNGGARDTVLRYRNHANYRTARDAKWRTAMAQRTPSPTNGYCWIRRFQRDGLGILRVDS